MHKHPITLSTVPKQALSAFGKILTLARKEHVWRQCDLAERIGISRQTVSRMEAGDPNVAAGCYFAAAWLLDVPIFPGIDAKSTSSFLNMIFDMLKGKYSQRIAKREKKIENDF